MAGIQVSEFIQAPREKVFALASNFPEAADTVEAITKVEMLTGGPLGVGTRFRETRVLFGREASEEMEITTFEAPERYVLDAESHGAHYVTEFRFDEEDGGTRVTFTFNATPLSFFAKVMSFLTGWMLKSMVKMCAQDLADLKRKAEGTT